MNLNRDNAARTLQAGLQQMDLSLSEAQQHQLLNYLELLHKWNKTFNLSGVRDAEAMVSRHLLDSLSLLTCIDEVSSRPLRILDVGTGPGLPGIPLAICYPQSNLVLLDSNGKKTRFVFQAKIALGLDNVAVENCRIEHYQSPAQIDIVTSRAFSSLIEMVQGTWHLRGEEPAAMRWLAMKGLYPREEISGLPPQVQPGRAWRITIPGEQAERHIIELLCKPDPYTASGSAQESDNK